MIPEFLLAWYSPLALALLLVSLPALKAAQRRREDRRRIVRPYVGETIPGRAPPVL